MIGTTSLRAALMAGTALAWPGLALAQPAPNARPTGGQVVAGSAAINQADPARTQVTQTSDRAVVNWGTFDVGRDHTVRFQQPAATSMTLNRVTGPDPSQIAGRIQANGGVAIVNQSGVVFHQGAQVDVGTLVVSAAGTTNQAFMAGGRLVLDQPGRPGARIENNGTITVRDTGLAALVAPQVANRGTITARAGRVALGGAETSVVDLHGDGMLSLEVTSPVRTRPANGGALVSNDGTITATGGTIQLTAAAVDGIVGDLVRAGGRINADTDASGRAGRVIVSGTGGSVRIEGEVTARGLADGTRGGTVQAIGSGNTLVTGTGRVDASGRAGGGRVELGTNAVGAAATRLSRRTGIAAGGVVRADATGAGNGGTVLLNSTESTVHAGEISVAGGPAGGNGGFVEVSGQSGLSLTGRVNVNAGAGGTYGTLLVDPRDLTVVANTTPQSPDDPVTGDATIGNGFINAFEGNLTLTATRDIIVGAAIARTAAGSLTLDAGEVVRLNAGITLSGSFSTLTVTAPGGTQIAPGVTTLSAPGGITLNGGTVFKPTGDLTLDVSNAGVTINTPLVLGAGNLTIVRDANINNLVQVTDANTVTIGTDVTQSGAGRIVAGTLDVSGGLSHLMGGDNSVLTITNLYSTNQTVFRNLRSVTITGDFGSQSSSFATLDVVGNVSLTTGGRLLAFNGPLTVTATGDVSAAVGSAMFGRGVSISTGGALTLGSELTSLPVSGSVPGPVSLTAGAGGIAQTGGFVRAGTLTLSSGGNALLGVSPADPLLGNRVDTLGASSVAGNLTLVAAATTASGIGTFTVNGAVNAGGTLALERRAGGSIVQGAGSVITAGRLDARVGSDGITLDGNNGIATLGDVSATNSLLVRNATSLRVGGLVSVSNSTARLDVTGDLTVAGTVEGRNGVALRASGDVRLEAGSAVRFVSGGFSGSSTSILAGFDFASGALNPAASGGILLGGDVIASGAGQAVTLGAGSGGIRQTGGTVSAANLTVSTTGDATLDVPGGNTVGQLSATAGGTFVLDNGGADLLLRGANAAARYGIITSGSLTVQSEVAATERASFRVNGLDVPPPSGGGVSVLIPGGTVTAPLVEIAPFDNIGVVLPLVPPDASGPPTLFLTPTTLSRLSGGALWIGATTFGGITTTTASDIFVVGSFAWPGTLDLRATGNVEQSPGTILSAGTLAGAAGGTFTLANAGNALPVLGDIAAGAGITLRTSGAQTITGTLSAPTVSLTTGGALAESGAGRITGGTLSLSTGGAATLEGANAVAALGASTVGGDLSLTNTSPTLTVPAGEVVTASGTLAVNQTGNLAVDGTVTGTAVAIRTTGDGAIRGTVSAPAVSLTTGGALTEGGVGRITSGTLTLSTGGNATLDGPNGIATLAGAAVGGALVLANTTPALTVPAGGVVTAPGGVAINQSGDLFLDGTITSPAVSLTTGGALTEGAGGRVTGGTLTLATGGSATLTGPNAIAALGASTVGGDLSLVNTSGTLTVLGGTTVTAGGTLGIAQAGSLVVDGTLAAPLVSLTTGGALTEGAAGRITGGTLTLSTGGAATLNGANAINVLGASTVGGDLSLANTSPTLTVPAGSLVNATGTLAINQSGDLFLDGTIASPTISLTTGGALTEGAAGRITGGTLTLSTGGAATLAGANAITGLGASTVGGDLRLRNTSGTLTVPAGGTVSAAGLLDIAQTGDLRLDGTLAAPRTSLAVTGALTEGTGGRIIGDTLTLSTGGAATLTGPNAISGLGASTVGGDLSLANTSGTLTVPLGNLVNASGTLAINQIGNLVVNGTVTGTATTLSATGTAAVNGNSAIARTGDLGVSGDTVAINGLIQAAGEIRLNAGILASVAGRAVAVRLTVTAPTVTFGGLDAATTSVDLSLGASGTGSGTLSVNGLRVFGGSGATLSGSIAGVTTEDAAALGRRGTAGGTLLDEPLPDRSAFQFNGCPIGVAICNPSPPPPPPPPPPPEPRTDLRGVVTVADGPFDVPTASDPASNPAVLDRLRPPSPDVSVRLFRDRSEEDEIAPPNIRGEDY